MAVKPAIADLPAAAMHRDQHGRLLCSFRRIQIADKLDAVVLGERNVRPH